MRKLVILLLLVVGVVSCTDPNEGSNFRMEEMDPIARGLATNSEYSLFVEMLERTNLYNALNLGGTYEFTVFVAANSTVEKYLEYNTEYESIDDMPLDEMEYLMKYHILSGLAIEAADLYLQLAVPTVTGKYLTAGINTETGDRYIDNGEDKNASNIIVRDMEYTNGYAHEVDNMLQPITSSIWDILSSDDDYSIFRELVEWCGLGGDDDYVDSEGNVLVAKEDMLFNRYMTTINGVDIEEDKTLFVVPNTAFMEHLKIDSDQADKMLELHPTGYTPGDLSTLLDPACELHQWVLYHAMYGAWGYAELTTFPTQYSESLFPELSHNLETMVTLSMISIIDDNNTIYINPHAGTEDGNVQFETYDIPAQNGYVHVVDKPMNIPSLVGCYTFVWDPLSKNEFKALENYGYVNRTDLAAKETDIEAGQIPGLNWASVPTSAARVYYRNTGEESLSDGDALVVELGFTGYFDMITPVLATDTYNVYTITGVDEDITTPGVGQISIDGVVLAAALDFSSVDYTPTKRAASSTLKFTEDKTHTFKFEPSGTSGAMGFDLIIFKPI